MGGSRFFGSPKFQVTLSSSTHSSWRCDKLTDLGIFTMVFGNMDGISLNLNYKYHYIIIIYSLYWNKEKYNGIYKRRIRSFRNRTGTKNGNWNIENQTEPFE
jgi:hypothetical protein